MKILFFVSSMHAGGAERVAATLCSAWARQGHQVTLAPTYTGKGTLFYELDPKVNVQWVADRMGAAARTPLAPAVKLWVLRRMVRDLQPDVVVSFLTNVNVMVLLATLGMAVPVIVCERSNPGVSTSASSNLQRLRRRLYPYAAMVTVQAEASVEPMKRMAPGVRRLAVVPNPLPPDLPLARGSTAVPAGGHGAGQAGDDTPSVPAPPAAVGRRRLVAMGRLVPLKGYGRLIDVFARLAPHFPQWDLVIWGEGPQRDALERQAAACGLQQRVQLPGRTATPWSELLAADLFVLTSEVEGFPNALIEAMALGLPCVSVDCPSGPAEITRKGQDALLVPLNDEAALENALAALMRDAGLRERLGKEGARSVRERYGLEQVLARWDTLFREAGVRMS